MNNRSKISERIRLVFGRHRAAVSAAVLLLSAAAAAGCAAGQSRSSVDRSATSTAAVHEAVEMMTEAANKDMAESREAESKAASGKDVQSTESPVSAENPAASENSASAEGSAESSSGDEIMENAAADYGTLEYSGYISGIEDGIYIFECDAEQSDIARLGLKLSDDTVIWSTEADGLADSSSISDGTAMNVWISPMMTRSIPPQTVASAIVLTSEDESAATAYAVVTGVGLDNQENVEIMTDRDLMLIPGGDCRIRLIQDGQTSEVGLSELADIIVEGDRVIVSYSMMTMSIPARTNPEMLTIVRL